MKSLVFLIITCVTAVIALKPFVDIFQRRRDDPFALHRRHNTPQNGTCTLISDGVAFNARVDGLTLTGETHEDDNLDESLSLDIEEGGCPVLQFKAEVFTTGKVCTKWHFGDGIGGIKDIQLSTLGNWTNGTVDGREIIPFSSESPEFKFADDGTPIPTPDIPDRLVSALSQVPDVVQETLNICIPPDNSTSLLFRRAPPGIRQLRPCLICSLSSRGLLFRCFVRCPLIGFGNIDCSGCLFGTPGVIYQCNAAGQGCCPVSCGSGQNIAGITVPIRCCGEGVNCIDPLLGVCCAPDHAVCRGPVCCNLGEVCVSQNCCPADQARGDVCCSRTPDACCDPNTPSRCFGDGMQSCVNGVWVFTPCPPPSFCLGFPVAGAGVTCMFPPPRPSGSS